MEKIELTKAQGKNLLVFLDRLPFKGIKEAVVVNGLVENIQKQLNDKKE